MPTDELIADIKQAAEAARKYRTAGVSVFHEYATPTVILALITELERLQGENERLQQRLPPLERYEGAPWEDQRRG